MRQAVVVAAVAAGLWTWTGVAVEHVALYGLFLAFVVATGWLTWRALAGAARGDGLRQLVMGWSLGLVLLIGAYLIASLLGVRDFWWVGPLLVAAAAARRGRAQAPGPPERPLPPGGRWAVAAIAVAALGLLAAGFFSQKPLPGTVDSVAYDADTVYTVALSAEADHRWPIRNPSVGGTPLPYHVFAHIQNAAAARLTGISHAELVMRLTPTGLFVLLALGLTLAGRAFGAGVPWAGPAAAGLALLVGEADVWTDRAYPFANVFFLDLFLSPTFLLGACLFVAALVVLREVLAGDPSRPGLWLAFGLLLFGCAGAKATTLPVLGVGIGAVVLWGLWRDRDLALRAFAAGCLLVVVFLGFYVVQYAGRSPGFELGKWPSLQQAELIAPLYGHLPPRLFEAASLVLGLAGMLGPPVLAAVGLVLLRRRLEPGQVLLAGSLAGGLVPLVVLDTIDDSHLYFVWYGYIAGAILAGVGAAALWAARRRAAVAVVAAVAAIGLLDQPLDLLPPLADRVRADQPLHSVDDATHRGMTAAVYEGLRWVRDHTGPDDVVATNIHYRDPAHDSRYFYVSAFTERRVFIESWLYTARTAELGYEAVAEGRLQPFPERLAPNEAVFTRGDRRALAELRRHGVTMLVALKRYGLGAVEVAKAAEPVFENEHVAVFSAG